jgi:hypothetical protein
MKLGEGAEHAIFDLVLNFVEAEIEFAVNFEQCAIDDMKPPESGKPMLSSRRKYHPKPGSPSLGHIWSWFFSGNRLARKWAAGGGRLYAAL